MSQQAIKARSDNRKKLHASSFSKLGYAVGLTNIHSIMWFFQYQKQLQDLVEKNAAAQGMKRKLVAELNDVS